MSYKEDPVACVRGVFLYLTLPVLLSLLFASNDPQHFALFIILNVTAYLLSTCIDDFFVKQRRYDTIAATVRVTPIYRRVLGLLPLLLCFLVFRPSSRGLAPTTVNVTINFTAFRGIYCLARGNTKDFIFLLVHNVSTKTLRLLYNVLANLTLTCIFHHP